MMSCCNNIPCNPAADAEIIYNSISGKMFHKNDNQSLINVIGRRTNVHMQRVREEYERLYQMDLLKDIEKNVHFNFKKLLVGLVKSYPEYRGEEVYKATKGLMTDKWALIDFIIGNDSRSVEEFKQFFRQKYEVSLVDFVRSETKGDFETILVRAAEARRVTGVQEDKIESDVETLYQAGQGKFGTTEETFSEILTTRSYEHLNLVDVRYKQRYENSLRQVIKKETSGWFQKSLIACMVPPQIHWAKRMRKAVRGLGTDDSLLVNCFSQCTKPMLQQIAIEYQRLYERHLDADIKSDTSGDYRELLLSLLDFPENERAQYIYNSVY